MRFPPNLMITLRKSFKMSEENLIFIDDTKWKLSIFIVVSMLALFRKVSMIIFMRKVCKCNPCLYIWYTSYEWLFSRKSLLTCLRLIKIRVAVLRRITEYFWIKHSSSSKFRCVCLNSHEQTTLVSLLAVINTFQCFTRECVLKWFQLYFSKTTIFQFRLCFITDKIKKDFFSIRLSFQQSNILYKDANSYLELNQGTIIVQQ